MKDNSFDLCSDKAKLDLHSIEHALAIGSGLALASCERALGAVQLAKREGSDRMQAAEQLFHAANALKEISISHYYVSEAKTRDSIEIV